MCCNACCKSFRVVLDLVIKYVNACCTLNYIIISAYWISLSICVGLVGPHLIQKELALCLIFDTLGAILSAKMVFASTNIASSESDMESDDKIILYTVQIFDACFGVRFNFNMGIWCIPFVLGNS